MKRPAPQPAPRAPRPVIGRLLATGFAVVGATAFGMCTMLLVLLADVRGTVQSMKRGEVSVRDSLALAMAVREQYIHQAHTIIAGNHSHLAHYEKWVERARQHAEALRAELPVADRPKVDHVLDESRQLDQLFKTELMPALDRGDHDRVKEIHRQAEQLSSLAVADADGIARLTEKQMAAWHMAAIDTSRLGLLTGAGCMLLVVVLSAVYTRRIRRSVVKPLEALAAAARKVGNGDYDMHLDEIGTGEFEVVAQACNSMMAELDARQARLVHAERLAVIGQLAAGVAHEINNPIGVIRGYLRTMSPGDDPVALREELAILDDEAAACQRIAEDLLAYARVGELQYERVQMDELLGEVARRFAESGEAGVHGVELDAQEGTLTGDARRLRQVVLNLVRNAAQVTSEGSAVEIVGTPTTDGGYEVRVLDRGPGVDPDDAQRIFEPFFTKRNGGSGLGLAVCEGIVRAHGGEISVDGRPGGGSIFTVLLPAAPPASARAA